MKYSQPALSDPPRRDLSLSNTAIELFRSVRPEIRHSLKNAICSRFAKESPAIAGLIMAAANKPPHRHAGRLAGLHAAHAVLNHQSATRIRPHGGGCVKKEIGGGLAPFHHLRSENPLVEIRRQSRQ